MNSIEAYLHELLIQQCDRFSKLNYVITQTVRRIFHRKILTEWSSFWILLTEKKILNPFTIFMFNLKKNSVNIRKVDELFSAWSKIKSISHCLSTNMRLKHLVKIWIIGCQFQFFQFSIALAKIKISVLIWMNLNLFVCLFDYLPVLCPINSLQSN